MTAATFLLPAVARFGAQRWLPEIAQALGRADAATQAAGRRAQLARHLDLPAGRWPLAALSRQVDAGDAATLESAWLRADPAWLRPDINGVRLMAHGDALGLTRADCDALLPVLRPVFGDAGFQLDAPVPSRWYLRLSRASRLPDFPDPGDALGTDLAGYEDDDSVEARRWRALGTEAQILLHNHPWNAARIAAGKPPVNALWFWGGGPLPDARSASDGRYAAVRTDDATLQALASPVAQVGGLPDSWTPDDGDTLSDLSSLRDLRQLQAAWLQPAIAAVARGELRTLTVDDEDGQVLHLRRRHRWRLWRRARVVTPPAAP
ncbi:MULTISPECIES: phosphoglycerate mutase [Luteimonas]|uniref:phosphoglycerate mutase n=1 Tax=Luteimonas TaxID=83614 RepID=UPI000C7D95F2|nr:MULTISPECIES: phosphoglycerate mutase [Luteimonas]